MALGEKSGDMVGCIISSEGFIGEACQPTGEYWYLQAGAHTGDCFMREAVFTRACRRRGYHSPLRGQGGVIILPCEEHLSGWLGASQRRLVWELGQTCEAAGDGTIRGIHMS